MPEDRLTVDDLLQRWVKVIDQDKCIGCHACTTACKSENEVPLGVTRTYVKSVEVGTFPQVRRAFQVTRCKREPVTARRPDGGLYAWATQGGEHDAGHVAAGHVSPDGTRRPRWLMRPLKPSVAGARWELLRALGGEVFVLNCPPYASVYLGPDGAPGGEGTGRVAGFWQALGLTPPAEPDHLTVLLSLYASLGEAAGESRRRSQGRSRPPDRRAPPHPARHARAGSARDADLDEPRGPAMGAAARQPGRPRCVGPAVTAMPGLGPEAPGRAVLTAPLRSPAGRKSLICGVLDHEQGAVTPAPGPSTRRLTVLARSNALIVVPEQVTALAAGDTVEVLELHQ